MFRNTINAMAKSLGVFLFISLPLSKQK